MFNDASNYKNNLLVNFIETTVYYSVFALAQAGGETTDMGNLNKENWRQIFKSDSWYCKLCVKKRKSNKY